MDGSGHSVRVFDIHVDLPFIYLEGAGDIAGRWSVDNIREPF